MSRLARLCARRRWTVILLWLAGTAALIAAAVAAPGPVTAEFSLPATESGRAAELLGDRYTEPDGSLVVADVAPEDPRVSALVARMRAVPGVTVGPFTTAPEGDISSAPLRISGADAAAELKRIRDSAGIRAELSGDDFADFAPGGAVEGAGLLAAAVILLVAFGSLIAMALPLFTGVMGVACGVALLTLARHLVPTADFAVYLTIMLGLGVGIDYALLVVTRFRTGLRDGLDVPDAVERAMATAGRSVLFAGVTVILTGAGILFLGPELGGGMALAAGAGVLMVMAAALTLLPALLALIGRRIDRFGLPYRSRSPAGRARSRSGGAGWCRPGRG
ncbi:MMPL family transporter [Thermocatellispora tengchongensis]|uniref:MMPL family transporter n=1 Tax=Thermocatellispora tengchongensis TaxID=1073253 RepID=UPI003624EE17